MLSKNTLTFPASLAAHWPRGPDVGMRPGEELCWSSPLPSVPPPSCLKSVQFYACPLLRGRAGPALIRGHSQWLCFLRRKSLLSR